MLPSPREAESWYQAVAVAKLTLDSALSMHWRGDYFGASRELRLAASQLQLALSLDGGENVKV